MQDQSLTLMQAHLATICDRCPHSLQPKNPGELWTCAQISQPIVPLAAKARPFCPLWYHTFGLPTTFKAKYTLRWLLSGVINRIYSTFKLCQADEAAINARRWACQNCPHHVDGKCGLCGCPTHAKTTIALEICPDNPPKWAAVATKSCRFMVWMQKRGILMKGPPPAWYYRWFIKKEKGGSGSCATCNNPAMQVDPQPCLTCGQNNPAMMTNGNPASAPIDHDSDQPTKIN